MTFEIVHNSIGSYGICFLSEPLYEKLHRNMPKKLRAKLESCCVGDYYTFPPTVSILDLIEWLTGRGIDVIIHSSVHPSKYPDS